MDLISASALALMLGSTGRRSFVGLIDRSGLGFLLGSSFGLLLVLLVDELCSAALISSSLRCRRVSEFTLMEL